MGCDIHMYAEVRNVDGTWKKVGKVFDSHYYDPERDTVTHEGGWIINDSKTDEPYEGRNYSLFSLLAGVRNGYGFAGVPTYQPVIPLFEGRGVPEDASREYKNIVADWDVDGHSHTYATLQELLEVDWDASARFDRVGFIHVKEYERIRNTDLKPNTWCGGVNGPNIQKITAEVYEREYRNVISDKVIDSKVSDIYIHYSWSDWPTEIFPDFIEGTITSLQKLGNPEDVRIVFFFDN